MAIATIKKCRPLQPPAISNDPSGMWMKFPSTVTGMPASRVSQTFTKAVIDWSSGLISSQTGSAK